MKMLAISLLAATVPAAAQHIADGDFDSLDPGTPPDVGTAAGAWHFPDAYVNFGLGEALPQNFTIVPTSTIDPDAPGNSLRVNVQEAVGSYHLPNLLKDVIHEGDGIVTVSFRAWVAGDAGGGSIYIGGDHGGGGFANASDRGPQLTFRPDGQLRVFNVQGQATTVAMFDKDTWQNIVLVIDLQSDTWDMLWSQGQDEPAMVNEQQSFRSGALSFIDRFTYARFPGEGGVADAYIDDITVDVSCAADCNADGTLDVLDFACFQLEWQNQTAFGDCDGNGAFTVLDFVCFQLHFQGCPDS